MGGILILLLFAQFLDAQTWMGLRVNGTRIVDSKNQEFIPQGFGVGEWSNTEAYMIEWPDGDGKYLWYYGYTRIHNYTDDMMGSNASSQYWQQWQANIITESDVALWHTWGVNTIRFSINYHWLSPQNGVFLQSGWDWIDQFISWCKKNNIYVVLCMHAAPGGQNPELMSDTPDGVPHLWTEPATYQPWTLSIWSAIAKRYANETSVAGYDLLDEPLLSEDNPTTGGDQVRAFYVNATNAIRAVDTNHIVFACGTAWCGSTEGMQAILPPWDKNMVMVFHKYWDNNDKASINGFLDIRDKYNVPLWNGETGESNNTWAEGMAQLLAQYNIGWSWWTYKKINQDEQPCKLPEPPNYNVIIQYVKGIGPKPSAQQADTILLAMSGNSSTNHCTWNKGLLTALGLNATVP